MLKDLKADGYNGFIVETKLEPAPASEKITVGSSVKVKKGAKTYSGGGLASFVYERVYTVSEVNNDRVVITDGRGGTVVAAVNIKDLILTK